MLENIITKKGAKVVEQISISGELYHDTDTLVSPKSIIENHINILLKAFNKDEIYIYNYNNSDYIAIKNELGKDIILLMKNAHYLGKPHPLYKKRIQIPKNFINVYEDLKNEFDVKFVGIYINETNLIMCVFNETNYINGKANNSSAHVLINDIYQATISGYFRRVDQNNNIIETCNIDNFKQLILGKLSFIEDVNIFDEINEKIPFNNDIYVINALTEMYESNDNNWRQCEWQGFYLEYLYKNIIKDNSKISFVSDKTKTGLDFDLYFNEYNFSGDLKTTSENVLSVICNDKSSMLKSIENNGKIWYVIYEHSSEKDNDLNNYENVVKRNQYIDSKLPDNKKKHKDLSYKSKLKTKINFRRMFVLELNKSNIHIATKDMKQGVNSNGKSRKMKLQFSKNNVDNFIIYKYERHV